MPPSRHSSSSHSSHSSSRSSSSRSYSSHSSSSHSSSSRSSSSRSSYSSSSRGPSGHSSSSHSSSSYSGSASRGSGAPPRPNRPRVNQPTGYVSSGGSGLRPRTIYGRRHDYVYYPTPWVDTSTGTRFEKGYYDENGKRYEDVAFRGKDGMYRNVLCHCAYCGQDALMDLNAGDVGVKQLQCPSCGAPLEIRSLLDDEQQLGSFTYGQDASSPAQPRKRRRGCLISVIVTILVLVALEIYGAYLLRNEPSPDPSQQLLSISDSYYDYNQDDPLLLVQTGEQSFRPAESGETVSRTLFWDAESESFYDPETECWLWYNIDMDPPVWQYWVEGISSDYGDYGWMEHDDTGWYIEVSYGNWIEVPASYDTSSLWYID